MQLQVSAASAQPPCPYTWGSLQLGDHREGKDKLPISALHHGSPFHYIPGQELSAAAWSSHLVRLVMCG